MDWKRFGRKLSWPNRNIPSFILVFLFLYLCIKQINICTAMPLLRRLAALSSHRGGLGSIPSQVIWDLWWTKWHWGGFSPSTSVSPPNLYSTNCSTVTIIYHLGLVQWVNSDRSTKWIQSHPTKYNNKQSICTDCLVTG
jgi:hypothetical protein